MKEEKHVIRKWIYWFTLALAIIVIYKVLDNFTNVTNWIVNLFKILAPFVGGILIAYILYLPCEKLEKRILGNKKNKNSSRTNNEKMTFLKRHSRVISIAIVYIIAIIILAIILNCIIPVIIKNIIELANDVPGYYHSIVEKINELPADNFLRGEAAQNIISDIGKIDLKTFVDVNKIGEYAQGLFNTVTSIFNCFIAIIVSIYILTQRKQIIAFLAKATHATFKEKTYEKIRKYFKSGNEIFFKFLSSQLLDALVVGILTSVAMLIIGVKYAVLLGFMIGLFNLIPFFGAIVAVIITIIITLFTGGWAQTLIMTVVVIVLQQIDANIINPKIVGNSLKISQILVIFAVTVGGAYFGILGMFLSVPIVALIKIILEDKINEKNERKEKLKQIQE